MPLKRRRNSGHGDGSDRDIKGSSISVDSTGIASEKGSKTCGKKEDTGVQHEKASTPKSANVKSSGNRNNGEARVGACTRSRIVKKPKRDLSPPESPVKKQVQKETKSNTPEIKTKRQWELWSSEDKDAFFEALFEHGKDFDAIQNWIATKCKKKSIVAGLIKNKDQVRHLYYRTWHKISKFIKVDTEVKKEIQELYGLINYGVLRKKIKGVLNEKVGSKLNELVYTGCTAVKVRGKNVRIKTPMCNALKKLNNIDDHKSESSEKVPDKICVEMTPKTNAAWSFVQELATNPRLRMILKGDRKLSSVMNYLSCKWKPYRVKLKESLDGENDMDTVLQVYPHRECTIIPVSLHSIKETKINLAFNHYKHNVKKSATISKGKKTETIVPIPVCDNSVDGVESVLGKTFDSPRLSKGSKDPARTDCGSAFTVNVGAIVEGDNAVFPDTLLSPSQKRESSVLNTEGSSNTIELSCVKDTDGCVPMETDAANEQQDGCGSDKKTEHNVEELADIESRKVKEALERGLTSDRADMTLAELYLMFGKDGKLRMEYEWCKDENIPQHFCNMLRRLVNLAAIQFADLSTKSSSCSNSPCHSCGMVKNKARVSNARGQKNRYPLPSKYGEQFIDASTQTSVSHPVLKNVDNSGPKDAVFRVPVCSPAFLQRSLALPSRSKPNQTHSNTNFLPPQRGLKKIRTNRKQLSIQRNILPKQPMVAVLRPSIGRQPLPLSVCPPVNLFNVPNNGVRLQPRIATTTGTPGGTPVQLNVRPQSPQVEATPVSDNNNIGHLLSGINIDLQENSTAVPLTNPASVKDTTPQSTLSPPNMPNLLDISLSNLPTGNMLKKKPALLKAFLEDTEWAEGLIKCQEESVVEIVARDVDETETEAGVSKRRVKKRKLHNNPSESSENSEYDSNSEYYSNCEYDSSYEYDSNLESDSMSSHASESSEHQCIKKKNRGAQKAKGRSKKRYKERQYDSDSDGIRKNKTKLGQGRKFNKPIEIGENSECDSNLESESSTKESSSSRGNKKQYKERQYDSDSDGIRKNKTKLGQGRKFNKPIEIGENSECDSNLESESSTKESSSSRGNKKQYKERQYDSDSDGIRKNKTKLGQGRKFNKPIEIGENSECDSNLESESSTKESSSSRGNKKRYKERQYDSDSDGIRKNKTKLGQGRKFNKPIEIGENSECDSNLESESSTKESSSSRGNKKQYKERQYDSDSDGIRKNKTKLGQGRKFNKPIEIGENSECDSNLESESSTKESSSSRGNKKQYKERQYDSDSDGIRKNKTKLGQGRKFNKPIEIGENSECDSNLESESSTKESSSSRGNKKQYKERQYDSDSDGIRKNKTKLGQGRKFNKPIEIGENSECDSNLESESSTKESSSSRGNKKQYKERQYDSDSDGIRKNKTKLGQGRKFNKPVEISENSECDSNLESESSEYRSKHSRKRPYGSDSSGESDSGSTENLKPKKRKYDIAKDFPDESKRCETKVAKKYRKKDINNPKIFVRRLMKSKFKSGGKMKKTERIWNQVHACLICHKVVTNFAKHVRKHKTTRVTEILDASKTRGKKHKVVRAMWDCLRNEGDHHHNKRVLQKGKGEIILGRRHHGALDISKYGPCPGCYVWNKLDKTIYRHQEICPAVITKQCEANNKLGLKELRVQAMHLAGKISTSASKTLIKEVFPIMTNDELSETAQKDPLIISLGNLWLLKNIGNKLKRKYYTSSRMRGAARLLHNLRKITGMEGGFHEFLKPKFFDDLIKGTLLTASPDFDDEEDLKAPSTALKLGYDVKRLTGAKWGIALRKKDNEAAEDSKNLLKLVKFEWSVKVSKTALVTLQVRRYNKEKQLPEPKDLCTLQEHVKQELKKLNLKDHSGKTFRRAEVLTQTRLLLYNKRRSGEIEVISMKDYMKRTTGISDIDKAMRQELSELEMKLLETQDLMEVRGKYGRGVPVIIPGDLKEVMGYLVNAEAREKSGVLPSNSYLFPNTSIGVIRSYESLKKMCEEVKLLKPEKITSVNLRKYMATISQIFDLSKQQQTWLANHLGHSLDIHKIHYRQTSGMIERVDIAKLMLMQELNVTAKYAGKKLEDIQLPEMVFAEDGQTDMMTDETEDEIIVGESAVLVDPLDENEDYQPDFNDNHDEYVFEEDDEDDNYGTAKIQKKKKKGSENYEKLIDLALGNSNSTFSTLLESQNQDVLNTPKKNPNKYSSRPGSPANPWLNTGEDGGDLTFMNFLTESPLKPPNQVSTASSMALQTTPLFSESSRDSIMGRLDVDGTLQSVLNENSIDYAVKFQDLAAHISGNMDCSLLLRKTDSSG